MTTTLYAPPMNDAEWITRAEAARRLGVSLQTLDRYVSIGRIGKRQNAVTRRVSLDGNDVERVRVERESV